MICKHSTQTSWWWHSQFDRGKEEKKSTLYSVAIVAVDTHITLRYYWAAAALSLSTALPPSILALFNASLSKLMCVSTDRDR